MAKPTVFGDDKKGTGKLCPLKSGDEDARECDQVDCAWWDDYKSTKRCKVKSFMEAITYAINMQFPKYPKRNEE